LTVGMGSTLVAALVGEGAALAGLISISMDPEPDASVPDFEPGAVGLVLVFNVDRCISWTHSLEEAGW
jgi:hypothetical protein